MVLASRFWCRVDLAIRSAGEPGWRVDRRVNDRELMASQGLKERCVRRRGWVRLVVDELDWFMVAFISFQRSIDCSVKELFRL